MTINRIANTAIALFLWQGTAFAQEIAIEDLIGTWSVDLYFSPGQPPSQTEMVISSINDGVLTGTFYGTDFDDARATVFEDQVLLTITTKDGSGPYVTSGRLSGATIEGQTFSIGRDFLMPWKAQRAD